MLHFPANKGEKKIQQKNKSAYKKAKQKGKCDRHNSASKRTITKVGYCVQHQRDELWKEKSFQRRKVESQRTCLLAQEKYQTMFPSVCFLGFSFFRSLFGRIHFCRANFAVQLNMVL